ncbi:MAG: hypothetical protein GY903_16225 [Fuerstiella sp.]|nr:hypothetical protein [Fuerstiella sp.]
MSRRRSNGDQEFGSDSFLDIIANIVGILIILIVVVGLRVARQPAIVASADTVGLAAADDADLASPAPFDVVSNAGNEPDASALNSATPDSAIVEKIKNDEVTAEPFPEVLGRADDVGHVTAIPHPSDRSAFDTVDFDRQIENLSLELTTVTANTATSEAELQKLLAVLQQQRSNEQLQQTRRNGIRQQKALLTASIAKLSKSVGATSVKATAFASTLSSLNDRQTYITGALKQIGRETLRLSEVLEAVEEQQPVEDRLRHRLSPVGDSVTEGEVHFRLSGGRIAHIPLESLLDRLKSQVSARRSVVMRFHRYEGVIGPIGGFHMRYTVERQNVSPLQALQYGQGAYRVSVSRWSILPAETLEAEPVDAALRVGSRMRQIMESTDPDTVVTVWLYPNDFKHFSRIREFAHGLNLRVAARPLPNGTPIAGSPNGSRSTSQ